MSRRRGPAPAQESVAWVLVLATTATAHLLARGPLAPPPWRHPSRLDGWWRQEGTAEATFALLRVAVVGAGVYLVGIGLLTLAWRLTRWVTILRLIDWLTTPTLRAVLLGTLSISGLSLGTLAGAVAAGAATPNPSAAAPSAAAPSVTAPSVTAPSVTAPSVSGGPAPVLRLLVPSSPVTMAVSPPSTGADQGGGPVLRHLGANPSSGPASPTSATAATTAPAPPSTTSPSTTSPTAASPPSTTPATTAPTSPAAAPTTIGPTPTITGTTPSTTAPIGPAPSARQSPGAPRNRAPAPASVGASSSARRTVKPGDSLWSIAEDTLTSAQGANPTPGALAQYWWDVVQTNQSSLPDPGDPDLIFPGDVIVLPPPPAS